jgi:hypothetical protein
MIKQNINLYDYDRDYEMYDIEGYEFNVDDVEDEIMKEKVVSLHKSIDEYMKQNDIMHNNQTPYNDDKIIETIETKLNN